MARHFITSLAYLLVVKHCSGYATRLLTRDKCLKYKENLFSFVFPKVPCLAGVTRLQEASLCKEIQIKPQNTGIRGVFSKILFKLSISFAPTHFQIISICLDKIRICIVIELDRLCLYLLATKSLVVCLEIITRDQEAGVTNQPIRG